MEIKSASFVTSMAAYDTLENLEGKDGSGDRFDVKLKGDPEKALSLIRELPGVKFVQDLTTISAEDGICYFSVQAEQDTAREALFFACAKAGMPILEMTPQHAGLEQVFLRLSNSN